VLAPELDFANDLADRAATIAMDVFSGDVRVRIKDDDTPVTQADTAIEAMVRERVAEVFPADRVLGEEQGGDADAPGRVWIVDPIDATKNFARAIPVFATLIALQVDGSLDLGVVSAPALGERYEAVRGAGARMNGLPIRVSETTSVAEAQVTFSSLPALLAERPGMRGILDEAARTRGFGDFWIHVLVARGASEVAVEPELRLWDYAALKVVVEEAGGRMTTIDGGPVTDGGSVLTTNGPLHDEVVRRLADR
jgi:histidinol-phosphatase